MTTTKKATARRTSGNVYDVFYAHQATFDPNVSIEYVRRLCRDGYEVLVDQSGYRPEGEPKSYTLRPESEPTL